MDSCCSPHILQSGASFFVRFSQKWFCMWNYVHKNRNRDEITIFFWSRKPTTTRTFFWWGKRSQRSSSVTFHENYHRQPVGNETNLSSQNDHVISLEKYLCLWQRHIEENRCFSCPKSGDFSGRKTKAGKVSPKIWTGKRAGKLTLPGFRYSHLNTFQNDTPRFTYFPLKK